MKLESKTDIGFKKSESIMGADLIQYETKVSKSFHGQISSSVAEERLRLANVDRCYLTRESDVEPGKYVLSCLVNETVFHYCVTRANYDKLISGNFEYDNCQFPVYRPDTDEKHAMITYPKFTCYVCAFQCTNERKERQIHTKRHRLYECKFCNKLIPDTCFSKHTKKCSPEKHYLNCHICDYRTVHNNQMKRHMKMHDKKPLLCKLCRMCFPDDKLLQRHITSLCGTDKTSYCNICEKRISLEGWLRHHNTIHKDGYVKKEKGRTKHACPYPECGFKTFSRMRLLRHEKWKHIAKIPKSYKCDGCDYTAPFASRLKRHRQSCNRESEEVIMFM